MMNSAILIIKVQPCPTLGLPQGEDPMEKISHDEIPPPEHEQETTCTANPCNKPFLKPSSPCHPAVSTLPKPESQQPESESEDAEEDYISMYIMCKHDVRSQDTR